MIIMSRVKLAFISFLAVSISCALAQTEKLQDEKELEVVNFSSIKKVLQKDGLSQAAQDKKEQIAILKEEQNNLEKERYNYPTEDEIWGLASEVWLIKNAQILGWDFEKPDYGLDKSFRETLESMGFYQKKFRILMLNTPGVVHASIPGNDGTSIFLLSVPFIRSLDLTKLEISILLFEDFLRLEAGYFKKSVTTDKLKTLAGANFYGQKADLSLIEELIKNYSTQIEQKGFTFQQQFEITKRMDSFLKAKPELWNVYYRLLGKISSFLKTNVQYKDYIKLYPSPEMQLKWIGPEEKTF